MRGLNYARQYTSDLQTANRLCRCNTHKSAAQNTKVEIEVVSLSHYTCYVLMYIWCTVDCHSCIHNRRTECFSLRIESDIQNPDRDPPTPMHTAVLAALKS